MKRFLVFAGDNYYPAGGWGDYVDSYESAEEAHMAAAKQGYDWSHVVDLELGEEVDSEGKPITYEWEKDK